MEILNLEYHHKQLAIKALNKTQKIDEVAQLLGVDRHTVKNWINKFNIKYNTKTNRYYGEVIQRTGIAEKV